MGSSALTAVCPLFLASAANRSGIALQPYLQAVPVLAHRLSINRDSAAVGPVAQRGDGFGHHL